nr:TIGR02117 family protein [Rhizobium gei]
MRWFAAIAAVLALIFALGTVLPRPFLPSAESVRTEAATRRILVLSNPIHTDIAIPIDAETLARFPFLGESGMPVAHPDARWLVFGWGGRAFYMETPTWAELKPGPLLKGLTLDRAVIHADIAREIVQPSEHVTAFVVSDDGYEKLLSFIEASFSVEGGGIRAIAGAGYGTNDRFFEANGWFSAALGCNTWTAAGLREAGLSTGWWNPVPSSLRASLALHNG